MQFYCLLDRFKNLQKICSPCVNSPNHRDISVVLSTAPFSVSSPVSFIPFVFDKLADFTRPICRNGNNTCSSFQSLETEFETYHTLLDLSRRALMLQCLPHTHTTLVAPSCTCNMCRLSAAFCSVHRYLCGRQSQESTLPSPSFLRTSVGYY